SPLQMCQHHHVNNTMCMFVSISQSFSKNFHLISLRHSILATSQCKIAQAALDDRYANKFAPLDSTAIYPKSGHALLYTPFDRCNKMPYKSYLCLAHSISSFQILIPHKHQTPSSLLIIFMSKHLP